MKKVELFAVIIALIVFVAISFGVSYSYFSYNKTITEVNLATGQMQISFSNSTNTIENSQIPMSDELGKMLPYYLDFTVSGLVDLEEIYYEIYVLPDENNTLAGKYIKFYLTDQNDVPLTGAIPYDRFSNSNSGNGKRVYEKTILKSSDEVSSDFSQDYRLRVWVSDKYPEVTSQSFEFSIYLYAKNVKVNYMSSTFPQGIVDVKNLISHIYFEDETEENILEEYNAINSSKRFDLTDTNIYPSTGKVYAWLLDDSDDVGKYLLFIKTEGDLYTSSVEARFAGYTNLLSIDFGNFDTAGCFSFDEMFKDCSSLIELDFSTLSTNNLSSMYQTFYGCSSLTKIDFSGVNTVNCINMSGTFRNCINLVDIDLTGFSTDNNMTFDRMFDSCESLEYLDLSNFRTLNVTSMQRVFENCQRLIYLDVSHFRTPLVTTMYQMFYGCTSLEVLDLSSFYNGIALVNIQSMFQDCSSLTSLNLANFNTLSITTMSNVFSGCSSLRELDLSHFRTENVQNMSNMFKDCSSLTELDLSSFNVTNTLTNCSNMFAGCTNLSEIYVSGSWNYANVTESNGDNMFSGCSSLVGGKGTHYNSNAIGYGYAHIDEGELNPGYFKNIADRV